jgi:hypothetical protein
MRRIRTIAAAALLALATAPAVRAAPTAKDLQNFAGWSDAAIYCEFNPAPASRLGDAVCREMMRFAREAAARNGGIELHVPRALSDLERAYRMSAPLIELRIGAPESQAGISPLHVTVRAGVYVAGEERAGLLVHWEWAVTAFSPTDPALAVRHLRPVAEAVQELFDAIRAANPQAAAPPQPLPKAPVQAPPRRRAA